MSPLSRCGPSRPLDRLGQVRRHYVFRALFPRPSPLDGELDAHGGASIAAVSKHLRHTNPKITMERCGHLAPGFLQSEVDKLTLGLGAGDASAPRFAAPLLQAYRESGIADEAGASKSKKSQRIKWSGQWDSNSRPPAPKAGALPD